MPPAGWHQDPNDPTLLRWWNGAKWTEHSSPKVAPPIVSDRHPGARGSKEYGTSLVLCLLLGGFSVHNFYLGRLGSGIGFLLVYWLGLALSPAGIGIPLLIAAFVWWIVDLCCLRDYVVAANAPSTS